MAQSDVTPYRKTHVRFDISETVLVEPAFSIARYQHEIARDDSKSYAVMLRPGVGWSLAPYQQELSNIREKTQAAIGSPTLGLANFTTTAGMVEKPTFRAPTDLTGVTADASVASSGDNYIHKDVTAGSTWNASLTADIAARPQIPPLGVANVPVDRLLVQNSNLAPDSPFTFKFRTLGTEIESPDHFLTVYFGGPAMPDGRGFFGLRLSGGGLASLWEYVSSAWTLRDTWFYCAPSFFSRRLHSFTIWPHFIANRRVGHLAFIHDVTSLAASGGNVLSSYHANPTDTRLHTFEFYAPETESPVRTNVTGDGPLVLDGRRDQRFHAQFSVLRWPTSGTLVDLDFSLPFAVTKRADLVLSWEADVPTGCSVVGKLYDADTDVELTSTGSGTDYKTYHPNYQQNRYYATFTLTGDGTATPTLYGYATTRAAVAAVPSGVSEFTGGVVRSLNISGGEADPSHETASLQIDDPANALSTLRARASIPCQIETEYDPLDSTKRSVLFRGYAERNEAELLGNTGNQGVGAAGRTKVYPAANFYRFSLSCVGMWTRLHESLLFARINLANDETTDNLPRKVTDAVRFMISYAGFPSTMIDVPDSPLRFFPVPGNSDALIIQPLTNIGEWVVRTLRDWLGWFLVWDGNAGTGGMWRAIPPPTSPYRNLATFTLDAPSGKLPHRPESYGTSQTNWTGDDVTLVVAPILKYNGRRLRTWVKRPEANHIIVTGTGQLLPNRNGQNKLTQFATNFKSVDAMTASGGSVFHSADPTDPDYLGRFVPLAIVDPTLQTCEAVSWFARRYYDVTAHAIKMTSFYAPLVLVTDTADANQANPRPLRYYDPVTIVDGGVASQWLVRNCNPEISKDSVQMAYYELEAPRF